MTLEQAIEDTERAYKESRNGLQYALKRGETKFAERCKKDAEEYEQLVDWLRELQERRKQPEIIRCKDCKYYSIKHKLCKVNLYKPRNRYICSMPPNGFCNKAKRKTDA